MVRKQSLANKRRSQKRSNKKRARTIRSMRQVNEGGGFMNRFRGVKRNMYPSVLGEQLLNPDEPDEKTSVFEDTLQPLMTKPVSSDMKAKPVSSDMKTKPVLFDMGEEEEEEVFFSQRILDENLRNVLLLHVTSRYNISDKQFISEKQVDKIRQFIFDDTNKEIVLNPLIEHIKVLLIENTKKLFQILQKNEQQYNKELNTINLNIKELLEYSKKLGPDIYDVFFSIGDQITLYYYHNDSSLNFDDNYRIEAAKIIASLILCDIFKKRESGSASVFRESEFLTQHVNSIKEHIDLTAGGSKGNMKSKMSRRKSRTRKS